MEKQSQLLQAAMGGDFEQVKALVAEGTEVNFNSADGWTPLHLAAYFGHAGLVELLLDNGADIHIRSTNDMRNHALHAATANRKEEVVRLLLERGTDVNATQSGGFTALHEAALMGEMGLVSLLLEKGADAGIPKEDGQTALDLAEEKGHAEVAAALEGSR